MAAVSLLRLLRDWERAAAWQNLIRHLEEGRGGPAGHLSHCATGHADIKLLGAAPFRSQARSSTGLL